MEALTAAVVMVGAVLLADRVMSHRERLAERKHAWRVELVQLRADAFKADDIETLKQRVQRLELKGMR